MPNSEKRIYSFLKSKLKERGFRINEFYSRLGFSKATVYRVMKGLQTPTPIQQEKIIALLDFDETEKNIFCECISELEFNEQQLKAFAVFHGIFSGKPAALQADDTEFILYDDRKIIMTYREILDFVRGASKQKGFSCDIKIYACARDFGAMLEPIAALLAELPPERVSAEHLVRFYEDDDHGAALTFAAVLPLLRHGHYTLFARHIVGEYAPELLDNLIFIKLPDKYMVLSFKNDRYHDCFLAPKLYLPLMDRWEAMKSRHEPLLRERSVNVLLDMFREAEEECTSVLFKASPCTHYVERRVWEAAASRFTPENYQAFADALGDRKIAPEQVEIALNLAVDVLDQRYKHTQRNKSTILFTESGLRRFMETGVIYKNCSFIPPFTPKERKDILQNLLARHIDPGDNLTVVVINSEMDENLCIVAFDDGSFTVDINDPDLGYMADIHIYQPQLAQLFTAFGTRYVSENLAMNEGEMRAFMERLLASP
jgi:transcriptional regulator with XRE-family HTH domain